jgi:hypothetical protein
MNYLVFLARMFLYTLVGALSLALVAALVFFSWRMAAPEASQTPRRLRWHMIAKQKVLRGTKLREDDVTWKVSRIPEDTPYLSASRFAVGRYAAGDIAEGELLRPAELSVYAPSDATDNGMVVPVEAKTEYTQSLKPGMRLAFVQEKVILPAANEATPEKGEPGFPLLSVTHSARDAAVTTLTVRVEKSQLKVAPLLGTGSWRPLVMGAYKAEATGAPKTAKKKPRPRRPARRKSRKR